MKTTLIATFTCLASFAIQADPFTLIAHRGASGYLPEHTLEAASLAHAQQPDFIEQDVVITKDDQAVVLHDIHLETVTNVEQVFPNRHREDGRYYAIDFTLAELKTLRVHERENADGSMVFPNRYHGNGHFTIATLSEHIETIAELNRLTGRDIGYYPEIKSPAFHRQEGKDISKIVLAILRHYHLDSAEANIYVQCFDFEELRRLRNELGAKVKLIQLLAENSWHESPTDYDQLKTAQGMQTIAEVAQGIGPWLGQMSDPNADTPFVLADWVKAAQKAGLAVHPYTFRMDALPPGLQAEQVLSILKNQWHVNGVFTDQVPPVKALLNKQ